MMAGESTAGEGLRENKWVRNGGGQGGRGLWSKVCLDFRGQEVTRKVQVPGSPRGGAPHGLHHRRKGRREVDLGHVQGSSIFFHPAPPVAATARANNPRQQGEASALQDAPPLAAGVCATGPVLALACDAGRWVGAALQWGRRGQDMNDPPSHPSGFFVVARGVHGGTSTSSVGAAGSQVTS